MAGPLRAVAAVSVLAAMASVIILTGCTAGNGSGNDTTAPEATTAVHAETKNGYPRATAPTDSPFGFHPASVKSGDRDTGGPEPGGRGANGHGAGSSGPGGRGANGHSVGGSGPGGRGAGATADRYGDAENIGVGWTREGLYAFWFMVEPDPGSGEYDFSRYDEQWGSVPEDIQILANIAPQGRRDQGRCREGSYLPADEEGYTAFVTATVERYDGDGIDDMPGLVNPIKFWQVGNEPSQSRREGFAGLQRITYGAIKQACPDCRVLMGGVPGGPRGYIENFEENYAPILEELGGRYVDIFDFHWYGTAGGDYRLRERDSGEDVYDYLRRRLAEMGFSADMPVWITEMGSYSGRPSAMAGGADTFPYQSEAQQAADHFRRFIYPLSRGVEKVFLAFGLIEGFKGGNGYFDNTGIIYDGRYDYDLGRGVRKLSYYTYKKMSELLDGADWSTLEMLREGTSPDGGGDHLYLFRLLRDGEPVYIAWWDWFDEPRYEPGDTRALTIEGLDRRQAEVTAVVPSAGHGRDVGDYESAFDRETVPVRDGTLTIELGESPVIVTGNK